MARHAKGLICLALPRQRCQELGLPLQGPAHGQEMHCARADKSLAFTVSIEAAEGVSTGISAADRALTIQRAVTGNASDIVQPGHVFPLQAADGGIWTRPGHTEAGCDLAALAGCSPAAVICAILRADGNTMREEDVSSFAYAHRLKVGRISDLIAYRIRREVWAQRMATQTVQTHYGSFIARAYREACTNRLHIALIKGKWSKNEPVYTRIHDSASVLHMLSTHSRHGDEDSLHATLCQLQQLSQGVVILLNCSEAGARVFGSVMLQQKSKAADGEMLAWQRHGVCLHILRDCQVCKPDFAHDCLRLGKKCESASVIEEKINCSY